MGNLGGAIYRTVDNRDVADGAGRAGSELRCHEVVRLESEGGLKRQVES